MTRQHHHLRWTDSFMSPDEMRQRLQEVQTEIAELRAFVEAVERGEHDNEAAISSAAARLLPPAPEPKGLFGRSRPPKPDTRIDQVRKIQRMSLMKQALDRMNQELYPELHQLRFKLGL